MEFNAVDKVVLFNRLHATGVRYILIGRQAVALYGAPLYSLDWDIFLHPSHEDLERLRAVAAEFDLEGFPAPGERVPFFNLYADNLKVDVFRARKYGLPDGTDLDFEAMYARHVTRSDETLTVHLPAIDDLIATKRLGNRPKDLEDIAYLEAIRRMQPGP